MLRTAVFVLAGIVLVMGCVSGAQATPIELVLVVDGSGSINADEWLLQQQGYYNAIMAVVPTDGSVSIAGVVFSTTVSTFLGLTPVTDATSLDTVANAFLNANRGGLGSLTNISGAIEVAEGLFSDTATSAIIDVSTDGVWNVGVNPAGPASTVGTAAWAVANSADVLNALGIGVTPDFAYGPGSFNTSAPDFASFRAALQDKLERETGVPEPGTMALLGIGLLGIGGVVVRRRRRS
jgi:hypothetical protein